MKTSVIIPTYNGGKKILNALQSLEKQIKLPDEVVVVIDGSSDGTATLLESSNLSLPNFKIISQPNMGRAKVRNNGAVIATGELLLFLDDDMIVPEGWVAAHMEHHNNHRSSILCGRLEPVTGYAKGEFKLYEEWLNSKWNDVILSSGEGEESVLLNSPYLAASNFSIAKELFLELGQFDERLNDAEDYDFAIKSSKLGVPIYVGNKAFAFHNDTGLNSFKTYVRRIKQYRIAQERLVSLKPEIYGDPKLNKRYPTVPTGLKGKAFSFFAADFWIEAIDMGVFRFVPKRFRCKFYDIVVTASGSYFPNKVTV